MIEDIKTVYEQEKNNFYDFLKEMDAHRYREYFISLLGTKKREGYWHPRQ